MQQFSTAQSRPLALSASTESQVYGLFTLAMALTVLGVFFGITQASFLLSSGISLFLILAELAIVFTSRLWMDKSPLNIILFALFPVLSGITFAPYILMVLTGYANGSAILFNALTATVFMGLAATVFARTTSWNLGVMGRGLLFALLGLVGVGLLQLFVPALRTPAMELLISGAGVVLFAFFTAYDIQRIQGQSRLGANPFMLALSLYLDIFNLFVYILRFMTALSGERR